MSASERSEVNAAIADFKSNYISSDMSDREKELKIIEWLVENCYYEQADNWENGTAYSCIINGRAQCSGYADAFLQTAKACGLEARYVYNTSHAWNLVKLDGDWYHVDVTWEDPIGSNDYGFGNLRNMYINLEDAEVRTMPSHHSWSPTTIKANGTKYGPNTVANYLSSGEIDTSLGTSFSEEANKVYEEADIVIDYTSASQAIAEVKEYMDGIIADRAEEYDFIIRYPASYKASDSSDSLAIYDLNDEIEAPVEKYINSTYGDILRFEETILITKGEDGENRMYGQGDGKLFYNRVTEKDYAYTVNYIDIDTGESIGSQEGEAGMNEKITLKLPSGYGWTDDPENNWEEISGDVEFKGRFIYIRGTFDVELNVMLKAL